MSLFNKFTQGESIILACKQNSDKREVEDLAEAMD